MKKGIKRLFKKHLISGSESSLQKYKEDGNFIYQRKHRKSNTISQHKQLSLHQLKTRRWIPIRKASIRKSQSKKKSNQRSQSIQILQLMKNLLSNKKKNQLSLNQISLSQHLSLRGKSSTSPSKWIQTQISQMLICHKYLMMQILTN